MNQITKLVLTFVAGVAVGVLGATSTLFQGEPEPSPTDIVTNDTAAETGSETGQSPEQAVEPRAPLEQPAAGIESPRPEAEAPRARRESELVETVPPQSSVPEAEQRAGENGEESMPVEQEGEERIFCMLLENSGRCQCYDADTMASAGISDEACREQLAEE